MPLVGLVHLPDFPFYPQQQVQHELHLLLVEVGLLVAGLEVLLELPVPAAKTLLFKDVPLPAVAVPPGLPSDDKVVALVAFLLEAESAEEVDLFPNVAVGTKIGCIYR